MKLKLLIPLLAAALTLSACADIPPVREPVPIEQQVIISPPEDGWTAEEIMSHSYINDVQLEYPLTMRSLGSGFTIMGLYSPAYADDSGELWYSLYYNDPENDYRSPTFGSVSYGRNEYNPTADDTVSKIKFFSDLISINGVKYSTPEEDIEKLLGKPDDILEEGNKFINYIYRDRESGKELITVRVIISDKKVTHVTITL